MITLAPARRRHQSHQPHRALAVLAILITLFVLTWAGIRAYAAWHFFVARSIAGHMNEQGEVTDGDIDRAMTSMGRALARFPRNPEYLDFTGKLLELQADRPGVVGVERQQLLENAAEKYSMALDVRPLWPPGWANLLGVKDRIGMVDAEFRLALRRCVETGPEDPPVQLQVINSGLRHWDNLAAREQRVVRDTIAHAMLTQPKPVFRVVQQLERPDLVCDKGYDYPQVKQWCTGFGMPE